MAFIIKKYESTELGGLIVNAKISTEEAAVAGTEPTDPADAALTVYSSGSRKRHGIHARGLICTRLVGTAPNQFTKRTFVTMLTQAAYDAASVGSTLTIGGTAWTVRAKEPERAR